VAFDIDKLPTSPPEALDEVYLAGLAEQAREMLPEPFASTACVYKLSSSAGLDGWQTASMHLWFWLDRPVFDLSWRAWAEGVKVDSSLFKSVQPHYTADPVFEGGTDPLRGFRIGRLPGVVDVVEVPDGLDDWAGWDRKAKAALEARKAELAEAKARIIGAPEQSTSATRKYALQALDGMVTDVLAAGIGERHGTLVTKAYKLGGYVQDGFLCEAEAIDAMTACVHAVFPAKRHRDELRAVAEMVAAGMKSPLDLSHIGRKPKLSLVGGTVGNAALKVEEAQEPKPKKAKPAKKGGPEWVDVGQKGKILSTSHNMAVLLDWLGYQPRRNLMSHQTDWEGAPSDIAMECRQTAMGGVIMDAAIQNGWRLPSTDCWRHLGVVEARRSFHPVTDWVRAKPWDGVSRFGQLFDTLDIQDEFEGHRDLLRVQLDKWLLSGGKCLVLDALSGDGVAAQGVLVVQGPQNLGKTRWFKALVPDSAWFSEGLTMDPSNTDHVIQGTSTFICELGELDSTTRKSDVAQLKAFLTRSKDVYRSPYGRDREVYARRTIFGATVNPDTFLVDDTGNRRFWVMPVKSVNADHNVDMQQVWAEAAARVTAGETFWMPDEYKARQLALAAKFETRSEWADDFFRVFRLPFGSETGQAVRVSDIRATIFPDRIWSTADMKSFTQFLKKIKVSITQRQGVSHATVVRW
jgi:hypothetical protein